MAECKIYVTKMPYNGQTRCYKLITKCYAGTGTLRGMGHSGLDSEYGLQDSTDARKVSLLISPSIMLQCYPCRHLCHREISTNARTHRIG